MWVGMARALADLSDFQFLGEAKFTKMCDSLPWTPMNRRAKLDAASLSSAEKSVAVQTRTNSNRYIHTLPISMCG